VQCEIFNGRAAWEACSATWNLGINSQGVWRIFIIRLMKSRRMICSRHVARMRTNRNEYRLLVRKAERKRPLGRPRCRQVDNIEIGWGGIAWIDLAQDKNKWRGLVNTKMILLVL
jgi:hypothetical protein